MAILDSVNTIETVDLEREIDKQQLSQLLSATNKSKEDYTNTLTTLKRALSQIDESSPYVTAVKNSIARKMIDESCDGKYDGIIYEITWYMYQ